MQTYLTCRPSESRLSWFADRSPVTTLGRGPNCLRALLCGHAFHRADVDCQGHKSAATQRGRYKLRCCTRHGTLFFGLVARERRCAHRRFVCFLPIVGLRMDQVVWAPSHGVCKSRRGARDVCCGLTQVSRQDQRSSQLDAQRSRHKLAASNEMQRLGLDLRRRRQKHSIDAATSRGDVSALTTSAAGASLRDSSGRCRTQFCKQ